MVLIVYSFTHYLVNECKRHFVIYHSADILDLFSLLIENTLALHSRTCRRTRLSVMRSSVGWLIFITLLKKTGYNKKILIINEKIPHRGSCLSKLLLLQGPFMIVALFTTFMVFIMFDGAVTWAPSWRWFTLANYNNNGSSLATLLRDSLEIHCVVVIWEFNYYLYSANSRI